SVTSETIVQLMKSMAKKLNQTFIIVTHERETFGDVDKVITIKDGKSFLGDQPSEMEVLV
ncbi:MAG: ABC transporter ATP-binding protein, partial [Thaumarchaeota archaeon]|nr:ABC transporter ATP-binding protein [Nitrososphaerota archaeon]